MLNLFRYIGLRHLQLKPVRNFLTLLGVGFGISLFVAISIINHSTQNSLRESVDSIVGKSKITVSAGPTGFDEKYVDEVKNTPGVASAVPLIEARAFFQGAKDSNDALNVLGVDLLQEQSVRNYKTTDQKIIDDPLTFLNQPDSIILTRHLAAQKGLKIDSKIRLATSEGSKVFTVRGLLEPEGVAKAYGGSLAIMDIDGARVTFAKENKVDRIDVVPSEGTTVEQLQENLRSRLGPSFSIETPEAQSSQLEHMVKSYQVVLTFFSSIALFVGLFLIMNAITVSVAERKKEIGILRALGATSRSMVALFVSEVVGIGFAGSVLGCFFGRFLASALVTQVTQSMEAQSQTRIDVTHLDFPFSQIVFSILIGTVASVLAALWPALKAAKVHPLETMKSVEESADRGGQKRIHRFMILGFLILAYVTVASYCHWGKLNPLLNLIEKAGSVTGIALLGPSLVLFLLILLSRLTRGFSFPILRLSQENLLKNPRRTSADVVALLIGLFLVMLISGIRSSFQETVGGWFDQVFVSDLMVSSNGRIITADVQPLDEKIEAEILKIPGVRAVGENRGTGSRLIRTHYHGKIVVIRALDRFSDEYQFKNIAVVGADRVETVKKIYESAEPTLLVSEALSQKQKLKTGETVVLDSPTGQVTFKIAGIVKDYTSSEGTFFLSRQVYKKFWNDRLVTSFQLRIEPGHSLEEVRSGIERELGQKYNLMVISNTEFKNQLRQTMDRSFAYTKAIEWIALIVGLLGLLNSLLISVMERTREIGMLRAVGATKAQISKMILSEAVLQGFFGACVAILLGGYVGYLFITYTLSDTLGWVMEFHFPYGSVLPTLVIGVVVAALAGYYPSRRASSLPISEALSSE